MKKKSKIEKYTDKEALDYHNSGKSGKIEITSQNHGFAVEQNSFDSDVDITFLNLNDDTVEGIQHKSWPVFSVQYHPEASPGPHDSRYLFDDFVEMLG